MTSRLPQLVGLSGRSGSGKDTAAAYLIHHHGYVRVAIADPIKRVVGELFDFDDAMLWEDARDTMVPRIGLTPRQVYQRFGTACLELDSEVWVRAWKERASLLIADGARVVCTDVRTQAEVNAVLDLGGVCWRLERSRTPKLGDEHVTEIALDAVPVSRWQGVIYNDNTLADLHQSVEVLLTRCLRC